MSNSKSISTHSRRAGFLVLMGATIGIGTAAQAQETTSAREDHAAFRQQVERSIHRNLSDAAVKGSDQRGIATIAIRVAPDGSVSSAHLVRPTGITRFDQEALRTARAVSYPATGKGRTVAMVLGFNQPVTAAREQEGQRLVLAWRNDQRVMLANRSAAQQPDS